ncbi:hypothetical protein OEZ85_002003 [Tetradesmus obliquus]|uniref:Cyanobacterial aminoacyl-tRNA synthetase CAAD domain-containing protein n=1 Tax=Tetradesmus obliquus TaxID=3088 RepID=A0ABY8U3W2_TETOB|nr:hypothetical protein OEZ85_002003 [Tetradesmus obliquus]
MQTLRAAHGSRLALGSSSSSRPHISTVHVHGLTRICSAALRQPRHAAQAQPRLPSRPAQQQQQQRCSNIIPRAEPEGGREVVYNKEFGYSRKDVLIIIVALIAAGVLMYEGLQATGMTPGMAGNWVQLIIFMGICVGWVSTYLWRVANKKMTYAQQLQMYEEEVMKKRLEEMTESEVQRLMAEVESERGGAAAAKPVEQQQKQQQQQ